MNNAAHKNVTILIPAYNPDNRLLQLVKDLIQARFSRIIIVNDGSNQECNDIFKILSSYKECLVIKHAINLGKGRALKTGFNYFLNHASDSIGVITVDADGQHAVEDIIKVRTQLLKQPKNLVLGVRDFSATNIPFRSKFGNILTRKIFTFAGGLKITDTQTGLRGIPVHFLRQLMNVSGERFEYELNMLLKCKPYNIRISEVNIQTIYIEDNKSSHFNPIVDSIKIYSVFLTYTLSSILSFGLDILLFTILSLALKDVIPPYFIIFATIGARLVSSLFNYMVNKHIVFKSTSKSAVVQYYFLSVCQMFLSSFGVYLLYLLFGNGEVLIKIFVDSILFLMSFYIQRAWVFKEKPGSNGEVLIGD